MRRNLLKTLYFMPPLNSDAPLRLELDSMDRHIKGSVLFSPALVTPHQSAPSTSAPTERPGVLRAQEMQQLYGPGAAMIHGMETAMQLAFDRNTDRSGSKLWPHLPLNIQFN